MLCRSRAGAALKAYAASAVGLAGGCQGARTEVNWSVLGGVCGTGAVPEAGAGAVPEAGDNASVSGQISCRLLRGFSCGWAAVAVQFCMQERGCKVGATIEASDCRGASLQLSCILPPVHVPIFTKKWNGAAGAGGGRDSGYCLGRPGSHAGIWQWCPVVEFDARLYPASDSVVGCRVEACVGLRCEELGCVLC